MDNSLGFLREWLPFVRRDRGTLASLHLQAWLAGLGRIPDDERARLLTERLKAVLAEQDNPNAQAKLLSVVDAEAASMLPALEMAVAAANLPLGTAASNAALAADNLLKAIANGYGKLAGRLSGRPPGIGLDEALSNALAGGAATLLRRQLLAYRAYAPASESSWLGFHHLYAIAQQYKEQAPGALASVEKHYHAALLLALADPMKFARDALPRLHRLCATMARHVRLYPCVGHQLPESASLFLVIPSEGRPARPLARNEKASRNDGYILDCNPAVGALRKEIAALETGRTSADASADDLPVMHMLISMWRGHPQRRFSRTRFKPRGELVAGFSDLLAAVSGAALIRRRGDDPPLADGNAPAVSEWAITDESPDGFGLRFLRGDVRRIDVGDIVAFRPRERGKTHLCLVRRITNAGPAQLELGLQELSPDAHAVAMSNPANGEATAAIYLPRMPTYRGATGLIVSGGTLSPGQLVTLAASGRTGRMTAARLLQGSPATCLFQLDAAPAV
jgi:hypothetical protein